MERKWPQFMFALKRVFPCTTRVFSALLAAAIYRCIRRTLFVRRHALLRALTLVLNHYHPCSLTSLQGNRGHLFRLFSGGLEYPMSSLDNGLSSDWSDSVGVNVAGNPVTQSIMVGTLF